MTTATALCPHCLSAPAASPCAACGFDSNAYRHHPLYLPPGTRLQNNYRLGRVLGQGGFGITYIGRDEKLAKTVAIKEYLPAALASRDVDSGHVIPLRNQETAFAKGLRSFIQEARKLAHFDHPNIVRVLHYFEANDSAYMVMEYIRGESVAQCLQRHEGRLPEAQALAIVYPVLDALQLMHAQQTYHLDVSAHNVLLRDDAAPVLIDFGAAKSLLGDYSQSISLVLKPGYSPLEQYSGNGAVGPWTDIYACGALLYLMLSGSLPPPAAERWNAPKAAFMLNELHCSKVCRNALRKALALKPEQRWQNVAAFRQGLSRSHRNGWPYSLGLIFGVAGLLSAWQWLEPRPVPVVIVETPSPASVVVKEETAAKLEKTPAVVAAPPLWQAYLDAAAQQRIKGRWEAAQRYYQAAVQQQAPSELLAAQAHALQADLRAAIRSAIEQSAWKKAERLLARARDSFPMANWQDAQQALADGIRKGKIQNLLQRAEQQLADLRLTLPADDNAYQSYQQVLELAPAHPLAREGLQRIAAQYARLARAQQDPDKRRQLLGKGLQVWPQQADLLALQAELQKPPSPAATAPVQSPENKTARESPLLELEQAERHLRQGEINAAYSAYQRLQLQAPQHPRLSGLRQALVQAQLQRARQLRAAGALSESLLAIARGLQLQPGQSALEQLQQDINTELSRRKTPDSAPEPAMEEDNRVVFTPSF